MHPNRPAATKRTRDRLHRVAMVVAVAGMLAACGGTEGGTDGPDDDQSPSSPPTSSPSSGTDLNGREDLTFDSCEALLPVEQLTEALGGADHHTGPVHTPAEANGLSIDLCRWDIVGEPMDQEPWFEWLTAVQVGLATGEPVTDASWRDGIEPDDCTETRTPDTGTTVCITENTDSGTAVFLYSLVAPASYVTVDLSSADMPVDELRVAAAGIVDLLAAPPA